MAGIGSGRGTGVITPSTSAGIVVSDANAVDRVLLGDLGNNDYGLKVTSSDGSTVIIDGTSDMFRIVASGTLTATFNAAPSAHISTVTLSSLGSFSTQPVVLWVVGTDNTSTAQRSIGIQLSVNGAAGTIAFFAEGYSSLSAGQLAVAVQATSNTVNPGTTAAGRYYVLVQVAI
jgi:hypothetical protein